MDGIRSSLGQNFLLGVFHNTCVCVHICFSTTTHDNANIVAGEQFMRTRCSTRYLLYFDSCSFEILILKAIGVLFFCV